MSLSKDQLYKIHGDIAPLLNHTPVLRSKTLSRMTGCDVMLKAELFQKTGSYKPRGMLWRLKNLSSEERQAGVLTFSAGNAAQGLAYAGAANGVQSTVVIPKTAPPSKIAATKQYGATVILRDTPLEAFDFAKAHCAETGKIFISSYDDELLMEGHATLGLELAEDGVLKDAHAIFVGVGGGGMIGGLAKSLDALNLSTALYGVEPTGAPGFSLAMKAGKPVNLEKVNTIADGLAAPNAGALCLEATANRLTDLLLIDDDEIRNAMQLLMTRCKLFAEPAGAAALAGLIKSAPQLPRGAPVICVVSGGNIDLERLCGII